MKTLHLLIVDDDQTIRMLLNAFFIGQGFRCSVASDGVEALKIFGVGTVDILITDLAMPGMDGLTLLRNVRERGTTTRCIVMTGYATLGNLTDCLRQGALALVPKPLGDLTQLSRAVLQAKEQLEDWITQLNTIVALRGPRTEKPPLPNNPTVGNDA